MFFYVLTQAPGDPWSLFRVKSHGSLTLELNQQCSICTSSMRRCNFEREKTGMSKKIMFWMAVDCG